MICYIVSQYQVNPSKLQDTYLQNSPSYSNDKYSAKTKTTALSKLLILLSIFSDVTVSND